MELKTRRIGPIGTTTRLVAAAGLLYLALFDGTRWGLEWYDAAVGLAVLPAAVIAFGLAARRYASGPVRFTGSTGTTVNCVLIIALAVNPYTAGGAALFYGATLLVAGWRAQPGCEATVLSNSILGRDDQLGCPVFSPIDHAETRLAMRTAARSRPNSTSTSSRIPAEVRLRQFHKRGSAGRGGAGTARFPDADVRRRFVEVEIAAALGPNPQAKEVERADEPRNAITPASTCGAQRQ